MFRPAKKRVLVIEEDKHLMSGVRDILELEDYLVLATADAYSAMLVIDDFCPDIVVLGIVFFGPDAQQQRLIGYCCYLYPIVYLSYVSFARKMTQCHLHTEEDEILTRPFDAQDLLDAISRIVQKQDTL
jgi:DNA-binding response OmpR family regulator